MEALRYLETAQSTSLVVTLPESFLRRRLEVIILPVDDPVERHRQQLPRRSPPASLAGKGKILGDIIGPVAPESDWDCLS